MDCQAPLKTLSCVLCTFLLFTASWSTLIAANSTAVPSARQTKTRESSVDWREQEQQALRSMRKHLSADTEIFLSPTGVVSFDGRTLFLGGCYYGPAEAYRSVLLVSHDGGKSWVDSGVWVAQSGVCFVECLDAKHAWAMTCWTTEGPQAPFFLFRTDDGGRTWQRSRTDLTPHFRTSLSWPTEFSFVDPHKGKVSFQSVLGDVCTYKTQDGGINWSLTRRVKGKVAPDYAGSPFDLFSGRKQAYRVKDNASPYLLVIEAFDKANGTWSRIGTIPKSYRLNGIDVLPDEKKPRNSVDTIHD